jgi:hypothetical protein
MYVALFCNIIDPDAIYRFECLGVSLNDALGFDFWCDPEIL